MRGTKIALVVYNSPEHKDPLVDAGQFQRGDVAWAQPADERISEALYNHSRYVIIHLPEVPSELAEELFLKAEEHDIRINPVAQFRAYKFDLDSAYTPKALRAFISRQSLLRELQLDLSVEQVKGLMIRKNPRFYPYHVRTLAQHQEAQLEAERNVAGSNR